MYFEQKIYINNKPLILTNSAAVCKHQTPAANGFDSFIGAFHRNFRLAKRQLESPFSTGIIIEDIDADVIEKELKAYFKPIFAGGGVVVNEEGSLLMIFRRGKWDLPKGKLDPGETIAACALREVQEETGLKTIELGAMIGETFHIYTENKKDLLKSTTWFHMRVSGVPVLIPQAEENILEAKWVPKNEIEEHAKLSYQGIRDVIKLSNLSK